jgi:ubiquinone/menaquinone biosynthesis C-methylase UbiE
MNDSFATKATNWDSPEKIIMTDKFVAELLLHVTMLPVWKALEIGAGTGLVGLQIEPLISKVVLEDTSESMLEVLKQKLTEKSNVEILQGEVFDYTAQDIDLVFSCMAFHHIPDTEKTLHHLATITKKGAWVVVGDLETENGSFHGFEPIPHRGFDTTLLSAQFETAGFNIILTKTYSSISKTIDAVTTNYNQFILVAQRK